MADAFRGTKQVEVKEVTVQDLGTHFEQSVRSTTVRASVIADSSTISVAPKLAPAPEAAVDVTEEPVRPAAPIRPAELEQWELVNAWGISIPSLSVRAPILLPSMKYWSTQSWDLLEQQMQVGLNHGAVAYPHSVNPGRDGSLIVAGHSSPPDEKSADSAYGSLFARLPEIEIGEEVEVMSGGEVVRYRVDSKEVVSPKATSILQQQPDESVLKLITCYPVGTTRDRMIITATKI